MGNRITRAAPHLPPQTVLARLHAEPRLWRRHRWEIIYQALTAPRQAQDIARMVGVSPTTVHRVISTYNRLGVAAVETPGTGGRRHEYLTLEQEHVFLQPFLARAARGELPTAAEIQQGFEAETKQSVAKSTIYRLLARHGLSKRGTPSRSTQTPQPKPANEQTVPVRKRGEWRATRANRQLSLHSYRSRLTDQEWARLAPLLPPAKPGGHPRTTDLRAVINAILYLDRTGGQWRALPHDFPPWSTVWSYFRTWRNDGTWERLHTALREQTRVKQGREPTPSAAIIDSQSVKTSQKGGSAATTGAKK
jgi:putative transposase